MYESEIKQCPICKTNLTKKTDVYVCNECNRYFTEVTLNMPNKVASTFYDLPERDQIIIAKQQMESARRVD